MIYSVDIEKAVLGACLNEDEEALEATTSALREQDFFLSSHQEIFKVVAWLYEQRRPVDCLTVTESLAATKRLDAVGGASYIHDLPQGVPSRMGARIRDYAERLKEATRKRGLLRLGEELVERAQGSGEQSGTLMQDAGRSLELIANDSVIEDASAAMHTVPTLDQWELERQSVNSPGLSFGIDALDDATGGMMPGEQTALGASSGVGKTSALVQAIRASCEQGIPCCAFLLEPTRGQVLRKLWSMVGGVRYAAVTKPWTARADEAQRVREAAEAVAEWPLQLYDKSSLTLEQILGLARVSISRNGTRLIAVDYIQRLKVRQIEGDEPMRLRVARASTALADLVKGTRCSCLLLSQLTTGRKSGAQAKPTMYDFRESSQIENDAHTIVLLHRNYDEAQGHYTDEGAIFVPKQRFGSPCNLEATFDSSMALWVSARRLYA